MQRTASKFLETWHQQTPAVPLIVRGARQVGKSYLVTSFGNKHFEHVITIDFERNPEYKDCFDTLEPLDIINKLRVLSKQPIEAGKTLLFFDEIQECPQAIMALRYFKETMPAQHVIAAGSLLEFVLADEAFRMPVGRVQFCYLEPLSFEEYLLAMGETNFLDFISQCQLDSAIPDVIHQKGMRLVKNYFMLGGMPAAVKIYQQTKNWQQVEVVQASILETYRADFAKYQSKINPVHLRKVFDAAPTLIGQQVKYNKIDAQTRSMYLKQAITDLNYAGVVQSVYATAAAGVPLQVYANTNRFKFVFLDIGLVNRVMKLDYTILQQQDVMLINQGALAEQFVGQELLSLMPRYEARQLFYWEREKKGSTAEVDYVINQGAMVIPVEVKSGKTGRLKSLQLFMAEKNSPLGLRLWGGGMTLDNKLLSLPLYMTGQIERLLKIE